MLVAFRIDELQKLGFRIIVDFANSYSYIPLSRTSISDGLKWIYNKKRINCLLPKFILVVRLVVSAKL